MFPDADLAPMSLPSSANYCELSVAVRIWDVRPFAPKERCVKIFQGNVHNFEKVSVLQTET